MLALHRAIIDGTIPETRIAVVISDQPDAGGLIAAQENGLKGLVIERCGPRGEHEQKIVAALSTHEVELVCLAGYMRFLSPLFIESYRGRILNIHPSLLPAFPGLEAQRQALEHGVKWTGCTVHFVDEALDAGPIIAQRVVPVLDEDTEQTLSTRILQQEHQLYPEAVALVLGGGYEMIGRRIIKRKQPPKLEDLRTLRTYRNKEDLGE